ncbi:MAG: bifunctional 4-hydroxy-2-oxoglutarate aldolase/2-dehydro-3-deoxy-phosphogluconate aldolase [Planctomycetota bacterium]
MNANQFVDEYRAARASAILRTHDQDVAREAMTAAVAGGFRVIEFTLSIPGANELIAEFSQRAGLIVGAGTVLTVNDARASAAAGASFLVSPVVDELVIEEAQRLGLAVMPGCSTPTEMLRAYRAGAQLQKLFPAPGTGPAWVKQTLGPLPFLKIVPTSGVTLENAAAFWQAGAHALGFVASLFPEADLTARRFDVIQSRAQQMLAAVQQA